MEKIKDTSIAEKPIIKKTIDSVIRQIKLSERTILKDLLGTIKTKPRVQKWKKSDKIQITKMIISIPEHIHVRFTLGNANVEFLDDFSNKTTMNSRNSKLKFKKIGNTLNLFDIDNGYFNVEAIEGGNYSFANTRELTIGRVSNSIINSEFTKVEIGEIGTNMEFIDFNSKFIFHNFSANFESLVMNTEYSEINLFLPDLLEYRLFTYGNRTKHIFENQVANLSNKNKKADAKMFELINSDNEDSNYIKINTVNGIIRIGKDFINIGE